MKFKNGVLDSPRMIHGLFTSTLKKSRIRKEYPLSKGYVFKDYKCVTSKSIVS